MSKIIVSMLIAVVVLLVPFFSNLVGGFVGGFSPFAYTETIGHFVFVLCFNMIDAVIAALSFNNLYVKGKLFISALPAILGSLSMAYFNFNIDISVDAQAAVAVALVPFYAVPFFVIPWIVIRGACSFVQRL